MDSDGLRNLSAVLVMILLLYAGLVFSNAGQANREKTKK